MMTDFLPTLGVYTARLDCTCIGEGLKHLHHNNANPESLAATDWIIDDETAFKESAKAILRRVLPGLPLESERVSETVS